MRSTGRSGWARMLGRCDASATWATWTRWRKRYGSIVSVSDVMIRTSDPRDSIYPNGSMKDRGWGFPVCQRPAGKRIQQVRCSDATWLGLIGFRASRTLRGRHLPPPPSPLRGATSPWRGRTWVLSVLPRFSGGGGPPDAVRWWRGRFRKRFSSRSFRPPGTDRRQPSAALACFRSSTKRAYSSAFCVSSGRRSR
jgi:hypothetical protein